MCRSGQRGAARQAPHGHAPLTSNPYTSYEQDGGGVVLEVGNVVLRGKPAWSRILKTPKP